MKYGSTLAMSLLGAATLLAAPPEEVPSDSADAALISLARQAVAGMLHRLPNYTCLETLERSERLAGEKRFRLLDRLRLEVAYVNGQELYAWPGSSKFDETDLHSLITGPGAFGTGDFGEHLRVTYREDMPLRLAGKQRINRRDAFKFTQIVPEIASRYDVIVPPYKATVAYSVTAWHDAASLNLLRFELLATDFPRSLPLRRSFIATEYETVTVNGLPVRLPAMTERSMTTRRHIENRTISTFSNCREYKGSSKLTFDEPASEEPDVLAQPKALVDLPAGVEVQVRLDDAVELKQAARGDQVRMTVSRDATSNGRKVLFAGAHVNGRWKLIQCRETPVDHCFAILETETYQDGPRSGRFEGALESPSLERELTAGARAYDVGRGLIIPREVSSAKNGAAIMYTGIVTKLPRGYRLIWRTLEVSGVTKQ